MRKPHLPCIVRGVTATLLLVLAGFPAAGPAAEFVRVGDLVEGRDMGMAAPLPDGRVLVTGGVGLDAQGNGVYLASAELFDPDTGNFSPTGPMQHGRDGNATITPLADGRVLVAGGISQDADGQPVALASAEVYDPRTGRFERTANDMSSPRYFHGAARLADGRVLVTGGWGIAGRLAGAELYDPATNRFSRVGDMGIERNSHTVTPLPDGRALVAGGLTTDAGLVASAEVFDPATGRFTPTGALAAPRMMATASPLADGSVLVVGGMDDSQWRVHGEVYDPATQRFATTGTLGWPRADHAQTLLPDGRVLVTAGGPDESGWRAERYDPPSRRFEAVANMGLGRGRAATAPLPDGRVLVAGGVRPWEPPLAYAEVYVPTTGAGPYPDLALTLWAGSAEVQPGRPFRHALTLRNDGEVAAAGVALEMTLPPGLAVIRTQVIASPGTGRWECTLSEDVLRCAPADNAPMPPPAAAGHPSPAVSVVVDAIAPRVSGSALHFAALASTTTVEDVTGNNAATSTVFVWEPGALAAGAAGDGPHAGAWSAPGLRRATPGHGLHGGDSRAR